jgi:serine/threonine protein kinase
MSPQVLEGMPFSAKCDVWSLGIMLYELLYGRPPWMGENQYHLSQNIKQQVIITHNCEAAHFPSETCPQLKSEVTAK